MFFKKELEKIDYWRSIGKLEEYFQCPCFIENKYRIIQYPKRDVEYLTFYIELDYLDPEDKDTFVYPTLQQKDELFQDSMKHMIENMQVFTKLRETIPVVCYIPRDGAIRR